MPTYNITLSAHISQTIPVTADNEEQAISLAKEQFTPTGELPQSYDLSVDGCEMLIPVPSDPGVCLYHDIPLVIYHGRLLCSICQSQPVTELA